MAARILLVGGIAVVVALVAYFRDRDPVPSIPPPPRIIRVENE